MKKKIIISVLIVAIVFGLAFTIPSVVSAAETINDAESENYFYHSLSQYYLYDKEVENNLINMSPTQMVNGVKENYISFEYVGNSEYSSVQNYDINLPSFSIDAQIYSLNVDYEYFVLPGFDEGYWICLNGFTINYNYNYNGRSTYFNDINLPISQYDDFIWYDDNDEEVLDLRFFSGFDVAEVVNGYIPSPITEISQLQIEIEFVTDLAVWNSKVCLQFIFEIYYPWLENGYKMLVCYVPLDELTGLNDVDFSAYLNSYYTTGSTSFTPIYNPMAVFAFKNLESISQYDKGFREGRTKGQKEGYIKGQASLNIDFTTWISSAVNGFMGFEIFPGISLMSVLSFVISLGLLFLILRFFSGG